MLTRLYANNFRCLVSFEAKFDEFGVFCGPNGSGKSSVFDALRLIRNLGSGDGMLGGSDEFDVPNLEFTSWSKSTTQEFEVTLQVNKYTFEYRIHFEQKEDFHKPRIILESASCDGESLFSRNLEGVTFRKHDGEATGFPLDWRQSALAAIQPRGSIGKLELLQQSISKLFIFRPNPRAMETESRGEVKHPDLSMSHLMSWYRSLAQEQEWTDSLRDALQEVWPDFRSFKLIDVGLNAKTLQLRFDPEEGPSTALYFNQLSDGERAIIALYMIRAAVEMGFAETVLIDEPGNFVGLPELQPWVLSMRELLDDRHQLIMISHHPEVLSSSGDENGHYLWRDNHSSPTRIGPLKVPAGLSVGEAIARGWVRGE